jgi:hypothetical protein
MSGTQEPRADLKSDEVTSEEFLLAFTPVHKRAFGMAVGAAMGLLLFAATVFCVVRGGHPAFVDLIANYYPGYSVSWPGAAIGFVWASFSFFVAGWFCAFCRNFVIAASIWMARTRAELAATRDFLDHI